MFVICPCIKCEISQFSESRSCLSCRVAKGYFSNKVHGLILMIILYRTLLLAPVYGPGPQITAPYKANVIECIRCLCRNVGDVKRVPPGCSLQKQSTRTLAQSAQLRRLIDTRSRTPRGFRWRWIFNHHWTIRTTTEFLLSRGPFI